MKNVFVVILLVSSVFSYGRNPQKEMEKKLIGTWCNPYTYEYSGELKGFTFKKGGRCEAVNVPSLDLKSWEIKDGALIIKGFMTDETGEKEEYETIESLELNKQTFQLVATLTPSTSTEGIIWTSSNSNVAVVNQDGLVIIKGAGKVTITVKSSSGTHSASCVITAVQLYAIVFDAQGGSVNPTSYTLKAGDKCTLPQASASGYVFQYWEYNGTHYSANTIFTMPAANVHMKGYWAQEGGGGGDGGC